MNPLFDIDVRVWQAIIAGGFLAIGWLVNGRQNRRDAAALRAEKLRDYHRAIYAEIGATLANLWGEDTLKDTARDITQRMEEDPDFIPLIPREQGDYVFNALIENIHILPRRTIDPIVAYYTQIKAIAAHAEDMRGQSFRGLSQRRRIMMYADYVQMKEQLYQFGVHANRMIKAYSEGGNEAADALLARLSTPDAGRSDRSQGSA